MPPTVPPPDFQARLQALEGLLREVETYPDRAAQAHTRGIVQALLELHALGLERLLEHVADREPIGQEIIDACGQDEIVSGLLLLHGLHPLGLEDRLRIGLELAQSQLDKHGGRLELLDIHDDGTVRLRLAGGCHGCASTQAQLRQAIEDAICAHAPEVARLVIEPAPDAADGRLALPVLAG